MTTARDVLAAALNAEILEGEYGADACLKVLREAGYVVVPIEPTAEMLQAAYNTGVLGYKLVYPAMIKAAP